MTTENKLNPLYKSLIDKKISAFETITCIYGGQTEDSLENRQKQHEEKNSKFRNMSIVKIFGSSTETQVDQINLAETYLIQFLHTKFGNKCLNVAMVGGGGQRHNKGDNHKIYIMYK